VGQNGISKTKAETDWPEARIERLKSLYADRWTLNAIGDMLRVSRSAVAGKVSRLELQKRGSGYRRSKEDTWSEGEITALKKMWGEGASIKSIGRYMERSEGSVLSKSLRLGLERRIAPAKKRPAPITSPARETSPPAGHGGKSLLDLTNGDCRWPNGDPGTPEFNQAWRTGQRRGRYIAIGRRHDVAHRNVTHSKA
jgi:hypothetical protein